MKNKILFLFCITAVSFLFDTNLYAQKPDMNAVNQQMAKAQKMLDSLKKVHPEIPSGTKIKALPNFESLNNENAKNVANLKTIQLQAQTQRQQGLPKLISANNAAALQSLTENEIKTIAQKMLPKAIEGLNGYDITLKDKLDKSVNDTTINVAGTGMLYAATGMPKQVCQYMVCKDLIHNPKNMWTINDLGIILRNEQRYPEAIQCFKYACSFSDSLYIIKTNLAYATFYYGDFTNAKKYFNEALAINPDFGSAMEGLALVAYQQGDVQALFSCLTKQVKGFGGGGPGPSDNFSNICGGVAMDEEMNNIGNQNQTNPNDDHSMDNADGDEGNQDPPPTADNEPPTYDESLGGMFAQNINQMQDLVFKTKSFYDIIKQKKDALQPKVAGVQKTLTRLSPPPYQDDQGQTVSPYSYEKFYTFFYIVEKQFSKRISWVNKQYEAEWKNLENSLSAQRGSFDENAAKEYSKCKNDQELHDYYCVWVPKAKGFLGQNLMGVSKLWSRYFKDITDIADWYISASSPFIKRVHKQDWNSYLNDVREYDIRQAILGFYSKWLPMQGLATDGFATDLLTKEVTCKTEVREIPATGPNAKDVKLKKLKTAPDYCDNKVSSTDLTVGGYGYKSDCSGTTVTIPIGKVGPVDIGLTYKTSISNRHKEDDYSRLGVTLGMGVSQKIGADGAGGSNASMKGSIDVKIEAGYQFGADGSVNGKYASTELAVGLKGKVTTGNDDADKYLHTAKFDKGFDIKVDVVALKGLDGNYGDWHTTNVSGTKH